MVIVRRSALFPLILAIVVATGGCGTVVTTLLGEAVQRVTDAAEAPSPHDGDAAVAVREPTGADASPARSDDLTDLYASVIPSVVSVQVVSRGTGEFPLLQPTPDAEMYVRGQGSGFIVDAEERLVVTNNHVVEGALVIEVVLHDGTTLDAEAVGADPDSDIAVLRLEPSDAALRPLEMGDSAGLRVGQRAIAIGNPFGWQGTMTVGIISGLGRTLNLGREVERLGGGRFSIPQMIQTDAAINFGNSGGPLLDDAGRVIGINTAINSVTGVSGGVGFAVPVDMVKRVLPVLVAEGHYEYPWLGIVGGDVLPVHVDAMELPVTRGAIVAEVVEGSPAARAGLRGASGIVDHYGLEVSVGGDVIVAVDDAPVRQFDDLLTYLVQGRAPGDTVRLAVIRGGEERLVRVRLAPRPAD